MAVMTTGRPQMELDQFRVIAIAAEREDVVLEFVNGRIGVKPVPDGDHGEIVMWLLERCMAQRPDLRLYPEQGLQVAHYRNGLAKPDGSLAPRRHFAGQGEWADPAGVLMVVEVTSYDADSRGATGSRSRRPTRRPASRCSCWWTGTPGPSRCTASPRAGATGAS